MTNLQNETDRAIAEVNAEAIHPQTIACPECSEPIEPTRNVTKFGYFDPPGSASFHRHDDKIFKADQPTVDCPKHGQVANTGHGFGCHACEGDEQRDLVRAEEDGADSITGANTDTGERS